MGVPVESLEPVVDADVFRGNVPSGGPDMVRAAVFFPGTEGRPTVQLLVEPVEQVFATLRARHSELPPDPTPAGDRCGCEPRF